jgi:hypothetical protein
VKVAEVAHANEDFSTRLGEVLFFTTLMAPNNSATGPLSRFTCETCHFEGYVDGRTHHTGRGNVRATTKPLLGLFNNAPYFSRALDRDLSEVVHAEFRVAGAGSGTSPWFSLDLRTHPWLRELGAPQPQFNPIELRQALMNFLMRFSHRRQPATFGRNAWSASERRGAALFAQACEGCHRAQLNAADPATRQPEGAWEPLTFSLNSPLVWGSSEYHKTEVQPYVHASGARVPSLRRLYKKWPYLTNGEAKSLEELLTRVRHSGDGDEHSQPFNHAGGSGIPLSDAEIADLTAFLGLL